MNTLKITEKEEKQIKELFSSQPVKKFSKNEIIVEPNSIYKNVYLIESGVIRTFYYSSKGDDISHWFSFENDIVTVLSSTLNQSESPYGLQALEGTSVRIITFNSFVELKESSPEITQLIEKLIISSFIKVANRLVDIQTRTAKERYENLLKEYPAIFQRINLSHIATYLGIKRQSLSRIRASK
ncbi:Crp/Fnr family transcriptional regulator [Aquimarina sp. Aq78]|uniref:Crp/Fnr family transcriptional regulator n=1 Tax=Aquimarina sp. Aq78 TaxID=1191889 RepID=UPI000D105440|nr:Crp/Fnr family transcriptional regulator [Aquimarina sp. Aq78]